MKGYHINIPWSEDGGGNSADVPDLEDCLACGATPEEALREVKLAKTPWLEAATTACRPIPKPKCQPANCSFAP